MIVSAVTLLPEPDSPTMPSVWPAAEREADPVDRGHDAVHDLELGPQVADVEQDVVGGRCPDGRGGRSMSRSCARPRIERVPQAVTDEVHGEHGHDDREAREERPPPVALGDELQAAREDVAPGRVRSGRRRTRGSSRTPRAMMLPATISDADDDDRAEGVGQDVPEDDPPVADADGARRLDELPLADRQEQAADEAADAHPARTARRSR